jgi:16S rRNA processing protein RimM
VVGAVKSVQDFGAGELLEIAPDGGGASFYLPFTVTVVPEIRVSRGYLVVNHPEEEIEGTWAD